MKIKRHALHLFCKTFLLLFSSHLIAEPAKNNLPSTVSLQGLVNIIRHHSPKLATEKTKIDIAQADVVAAEILPNPSISYGRYDMLAGKNTFWEGNQQQQTQLNIPVFVTGQRPARREAAAKGVLAAEAQVFTAYSELLKESWRLFIKLLALQEKMQVLKQSEQELRRLKTIISGWHEAGAASQYEVMRISVEVANLHTQNQQIETDMIDISGQLATSLGLPNWRPKAEGSLQALEVSVDMPKLAGMVESANPAVHAARLQEDSASATIKKVDSERWPVPVINIGNTWTNSPYGMASYAGLTVDIPLFDRGQGELAKAKAEKRAATYERQAMVASIQAELQRATEVLLKNKHNLQDFEKNVFTQLPQLQDMTQDAYQFGKASILELLDATRTQIELNTRYIELTEAVALSEVDILAAAGLLDEAANHPNAETTQHQ